jgi:hypothetical protein
VTALELAQTPFQIVNAHAGLVAAPGGRVQSSVLDSKPRAAVLESACTQEIRMIWLLTGLLSVALIFMSLRIGAWLLFKYDTGNRD